MNVLLHSGSTDMSLSHRYAEVTDDDWLALRVHGISTRQHGLSATTGLSPPARLVPATVSFPASRARARRYRANAWGFPAAAPSAGPAVRARASPAAASWAVRRAIVA